MKYKHLTPEQRYTIYVLLQNKKSRKEICETIKISQPTLCRELKRNSGQRERVEFKYKLLSGYIYYLYTKVMNELFGSGICLEVKTMILSCKRVYVIMA